MIRRNKDVQNNQTHDRSVSRNRRISRRIRRHKSSSNHEALKGTGRAKHEVNYRHGRVQPKDWRGSHP